MITGITYSCAEGGYSLPGVAACFAINAVEIAKCAVQCGAGAWNCFLVLFGTGDPALCTDDYPACMNCLEDLELDDCGCIPHTCFDDYPTNVYGDADIIYGGGCD